MAEVPSGSQQELVYLIWTKLDICFTPFTTSAGTCLLRVCGAGRTGNWRECAVEKLEQKSYIYLLSGSKQKRGLESHPGIFL